MIITKSQSIFFIENNSLKLLSHKIISLKLSSENITPLSFGVLIVKIFLFKKFKQEYIFFVHYLL
jgi:hypothetical protein